MAREIAEHGERKRQVDRDKAREREREKW